MKRLFILTTVFAFVAATGCEMKSGTAPSTDPNKPSATRKLTLTASGDHTITQGESDKIMVNVNRDNFKEPVTIEVSDLPKGITLESGDLTVPADQIKDIRSAMTIVGGRVVYDAAAPATAATR